MAWPPCTGPRTQPVPSGSAKVHLQPVSLFDSYETYTLHPNTIILKVKGLIKARTKLKQEENQ